MGAEYMGTPAGAVWKMMESDKVSEELEADKSSSTEGPDSPGLSPSSSPLPAMLPSEDGGPHVPRYSINFTDNVSKDGDVIQYTINVRKLEEDTEDNNIITLVREYEDIQFLDHQLVAHNRQAGLIFPSLPAKPASDPAGAESRSKKQLGSSNRSILGDSSQWGRDCRVLEKYLEMVAAHPVLGRSTHLASFLESASPPPRPAKMKKGWMAGVRDWALTYGSQIRDASEAYSAAGPFGWGPQHHCCWKRGGQWGLQQAHKRIFRLHRDYKDWGGRRGSGGRGDSWWLFGVVQPVSGSRECDAFETNVSHGRLGERCQSS